MNIPPEVATPLIGLLVAAIPTAVLWLKLRALELSGKIRDLKQDKTAAKVDEIHLAVGAPPSPSAAVTIPDATPIPK